MAFSNTMRKLMKLKLCYDYLGQKCDFASLLTAQSKGFEMEPTISAHETLFVRKLPYLNSKLRGVLQQIRVGDVVVMKDPLDSDNHVVRRLAAVNGSEMVSTNEEGEPFVLEDGQCWVLSDNKNLKPEESNDSRTYGPISITDIVGRAIYRFRTLGDQGFLVNNKVSMQSDQSVLFIELDMAELKLHNDEESKGSQT